MGREELEAALRREGDEQARLYWQDAEQQAESLRRENSMLLQRQQQAIRARLDAEITAIRETCRASAQQQAQQLRLQAEQQLAERLRRLAELQLPKLAVEGGDRLFSSLAAEIPEHGWTQVTVHPRDGELARQLFPRAEIVCSEQFSGGLKVETPEGRMIIINSLEKRLEHLWPELLPELLRELRRRVSGC